MKAKIEEKKRLLDDIRGRESGADWKEVNIALQRVIGDYAGAVRSQTLLSAGLDHLRRLKKKAFSTMTAKTQHELMRCLKILNLLDVGELIFITAEERKDTRGLHRNPDYPFTNPMLDKLLVIKKIDEKAVMEWREIKD